MASERSLKLARLTLGVSDIEVSESFYRDTLGLPVERKNDALVIPQDGFMITLSLKPPAGRSKLRLAFSVATDDEVDTWAERLREAGAEIVSGPANDDTARALILLDPDQYEIEIYSLQSR